jgi:signal transduction histidine kinase/CheY-like chemotaxis protein
MTTTSFGEIVASQRSRMSRGEPSPETLAENQALARELQAARAHARLLEEQLRDAQRFETLGRLASAVAHDFGNVMAVIVGYADIMLRRLDPTDPMRGSVESIRKATAWGQRLTEQVLAGVRGQAPQPVGPVDLNAIAATLGRTLQPVLGERTEVVTHLDPLLGGVNVSAGQLEQVLMNLLINARDAMEGGGRITIETANVDLDAGAGQRTRPVVMLRVSDTGAGMDPATMSRAFEPYFTTKPPGKGTGLGLSTVFGVVTQHGGHVEVASEVGEGATFTVYLPRAESPPATSLAARPAVLVLEERGDVRELLVDILALHEFTVLQAHEGDEAARVAERHGGPLALVIADLAAPGVRGGGIIARLAARHPDLKVLYVSGDVDDLVREAREERRGRIVVEKPFSVDSLMRGVRQALGGGAG